MPRNMPTLYAVDKRMKSLVEQARRKAVRDEIKACRLANKMLRNALANAKKDKTGSKAALARISARVAVQIDANNTRIRHLQMEV